VLGLLLLVWPQVVMAVAFMAYAVSAPATALTQKVRGFTEK
jgi:hypothetical protein